LSRLYDGGIAYEDEQLGKLFDQLKKLDLYDNTLIIVTADHGEGLGDSHAFSHPGSVYQEHIRIPLLVKFPHQHQPRVVQEPVSQIDVMPTVLATARLAVSSNLPGADLSAVEGMPPRDLLSVSYPCLSQRYPKLNRTSTAVISGGLKYIETSNGRRELYDLAHDPLELRNLYADDNRDTAVMSRALAAVLKTIPEYHRRLADREGLRFLKSLGYVQ
jgi:arylsulfatase A-like enzyme